MKVSKEIRAVALDVNGAKASVRLFSGSLVLLAGWSVSRLVRTCKESFRVAISSRLIRKRQLFHPLRASETYFKT